MLTKLMLSLLLPRLAYDLSGRPYAWEILSEIVGMDIIGLPFHEFMYVDEDVITMRVGKHGEYCYHIMEMKRS